MYRTGINRIFYHSYGGIEHLTVTAKVIDEKLDPINNTGIYTFTEYGEGIYYCDMVFTRYGRYLIFVYENGKLVKTHILDVRLERPSVR